MSWTADYPFSLADASGKLCTACNAACAYAIFAAKPLWSAAPPIWPRASGENACRSQRQMRNHAEDSTPANSPEARRATLVRSPSRTVGASLAHSIRAHNVAMTEQSLPSELGD